MNCVQAAGGGMDRGKAVREVAAGVMEQQLEIILPQFTELFCRRSSKLFCYISQNDFGVEAQNNFGGSAGYIVASKT